jgi:hypothetical protein
MLPSIAVLRLHLGRFFDFVCKLVCKRYLLPPVSLYFAVIYHFYAPYYQSDDQSIAGILRCMDIPAFEKPHSSLYNSMRLPRNTNLAGTSVEHICGEGVTVCFFFICSFVPENVNT